MVHTSFARQNKAQNESLTEQRFEWQEGHKVKDFGILTDDVDFLRTYYTKTRSRIVLPQNEGFV